jgi:predicted transcriptional regulator
MTDTEHAIETIEFIARSTNRVQLLETLHESGSADRAELREALSASRTTVTRNLDALVDRGLVCEVDGRYELSPGAELVVEGFRSLAADVATQSRLQPFLDGIDRGTFDVDLSHLTDATVTVAEPGDPLSMVNAHVSRIRESTDVTVVVPVTGLHAYEAVHETVLDDVVQVGVDDDGEPRALLETDDPVVRDWAHATLAAFRRDSEPVDLTAILETTED